MTAKKKKEHKKEEVKPEQKSEDLDDLRKKAGERDEYYDLMLRAHAELDNFSKRTEKDKARWKDNTLRDFIMDMIPALDALHVAISHPEDVEASALLDGIRLMEKQLAEVFGKNGVEMIEPTPGDEFDPAHHEAMTARESEEYEPGHIVEIMRRGFSISGTLIRAAQVVVVKEA